MSLKPKQTLLKQLIKKIGLSQKEFAGRYFCFILDENECGTKKEQEQFEERFKKQISRKSTNEELIDSYLTYLFTLKEAKCLEYPYINNKTSCYFSEEFNDRMKRISEKINNELS